MAICGLMVYAMMTLAGGTQTKWSPDHKVGAIVENRANANRAWIQHSLAWKHSQAETLNSTAIFRNSSLATLWHLLV